MACENSECYEDYARLFNPHNIALRTIVRRRKHWFLEDENAPGSADEVIQPANADPELIAEILAQFAGDGALITRKECKEEGCFCEYPDEPRWEVQEQDRRQAFDDIDYFYTVEKGVSSPDWTAIPLKLTFANGVEVPNYTPVGYHLELQSREPLVYVLKMKYWAKVSFDLTIDIWRSWGTCKPNAYYFARGEQRNRQRGG